jgi:hypothetical protein
MKSFELMKANPTLNTSDARKEAYGTGSEEWFRESRRVREHVAKYSAKAGLPLEVVEWESMTPRDEVVKTLEFLGV